MMYKIAVIGGGVQGLASALCVTQQIHDCEVTIISEQFYPSKENICSSHGLGVIISGKTNKMDNDLVTDRVVATMKYCASFKQHEANSIGILKTDAIIFYNKTEEGLNEQVSPRSREKYGYQRLTDKELETYKHVQQNGAMFFNDFKKDQWIVFRMPTYVVDLNLYLPWLRSQLEQKLHRNGGKKVRFVKQKVESIGDLAHSYHLVVNCSGLGARKLVSDQKVVPIRGQYLSVKAPFVDKVYLAYETIIVPRSGDVGLGVTAQIGRQDSDPDPHDMEDIRKRCEALHPPLKNAEFQHSAVGIRPGRIGGPRVELELMRTDQKVSPEFRSFPVIHNYGHGGKGFGLHWGCALEVAKMASAYFNTAKL